MVGFQWISSRFGRISMDFVKIWPDLAKVSSRKRSPVRSIGLGFSCKHPPTNLPVSVSRHVDPPPTVAGARSDGFRFRLEKVGRCRSNLDTLKRDPESLGETGLRPSLLWGSRGVI